MGVSGATYNVLFTWCLLVAICHHSLPSSQRFAQLPVILRITLKTDIVIALKAVIGDVHIVKMSGERFFQFYTESEKIEPILHKVPIDFGDSSTRVE